MNLNDQKKQQYPPPCWDAILAQAERSSVIRHFYEAVGVMRLVDDCESMHRDNPEQREQIETFFRKEIKRIVPQTVGLKAAEGAIFHTAGATWWLAVTLPIVSAIIVYIWQRKG